MDTPVTEKEFVGQLNQLNHKLNLVKELSFKDSKSVDDVKDVLIKLKIKAMSKIRTYLLEQIYKFRRPMTNYQVPQNTMLKHKFFFEFVLYNERQVAHEICTEYVETMSKIYYSYFKSYSSRLAALKYEDALTKDDLMGVEDTAKQSMFGKTAALRNKSTIFTIGSRGDILNQQLEAPILIPHAQQKNRVSPNEHNSVPLFRIKIIKIILLFFFLNASTRTKHCSGPSNMRWWTMRAESICSEPSSLWCAVHRLRICSIKSWARLWR